MMPRLTHVLAAFAAVLLLLGLSAPIAAQQGTPTPTNGTTATETEQIDQHTTLLSSSYYEKTGMASVTVRSAILQEITVTDAGAFMQGGEVPRRTVMVKPGDTATIEVPATEVQGWTGVSIATRSTLYAEPISEFETNTLSFVDRLTSPRALTVGAGSMVIWMVLAGLYVIWIEGGEPEVAG